MNRIASAAVLVLLMTAFPPAYAQAQAPAQSADDAAKGVTPKAAPEKPAAGPRLRARPSADARHCLQLATTVQIIKCAEKYR